MDPGLDGPSSSARIAASEDGRLAVVFVNGGSLYSVVASDKTRPFTQPAQVAQGSPGAPIIDPALDMGVHGAAYVAYVSTPGGGGGDIHVARLGDTDQSFTQFPGTLDQDSGHQAGTATAGRASPSPPTAPRSWPGARPAGCSCAASTATASRALIGASDSPLDGHTPGQADSPDVALEDDSSFGEVVLRQDFDNGNGRRCRASSPATWSAGDLGPAEGIDGLSFPVVEGADNPQLGMDLRGRGMASGTRMSSLTPTSAFLRNDAFAPGAVLGSLDNGGTDPQTVTAAGQNLTGGWRGCRRRPRRRTASWSRAASRSTTAYEDEVARRSRPASSAPVATNGGLFARQAPRVGDSIVGLRPGAVEQTGAWSALVRRRGSWGHADVRITSRVVHGQAAAAALAAGDVGVRACRPTPSTWTASRSARPRADDAAPAQPARRGARRHNCAGSRHDRRAARAKRSAATAARRASSATTPRGGTR